MKENKIHAFRLLPGADLKKSIGQYCEKNNIRAGAIISCVGSLATLNIRLAGAQTTFFREEKMEILSLSGTVSKNGCHLHICVADATGNTFGGHLVDGNPINTTAEIILVELGGMNFTRHPDPVTGYKELFIDFL